jgi:hypothetical protein
VDKAKARARARAKIARAKRAKAKENSRAEKRAPRPAASHRKMTALTETRSKQISRKAARGAEVPSMVSSPRNRRGTNQGYLKLKRDA